METAKTEKITLRLIAAVGTQGQIGLQGKLPWHSREDLAWFRKNTMGQLLIVGYKTYARLPELPGRKILIDNDLCPATVKAFLRATGGSAFVIGGAKTYAKWMPYIDLAHVNSIEYAGPADTFMPEITCPIVWGPGVFRTRPHTFDGEFGQTYQAVNDLSAAVEKFKKSVENFVKASAETEQNPVDKPAGEPLPAGKTPSADPMDKDLRALLSAVAIDRASSPVKVCYCSICHPEGPVGKSWLKWLELAEMATWAGEELLRKVKALPPNKTVVEVHELFGVAVRFPRESTELQIALAYLKALIKKENQA